MLVAYIVKVEGWKIVGRRYIVDTEQRSHKLLDTLIYIDSKQPATEQLGEDCIKNVVSDVDVISINRSTRHSLLTYIVPTVNKTFTQLSHNIVDKSSENSI